MLPLIADDFLYGVTSSEEKTLSQVGVSVLNCVFQIWTSAPSQSLHALRSTRSVSTLQEAMCASAPVAMKSKTASVSKLYSQVSISVLLAVTFFVITCIFFIIL